MKQIFSKRNSMLSVSALGLALLLAAASFNYKTNKETVSCKKHGLSHVCVMKTIFGFENVDDVFLAGGNVSSPAVEASLKKGLDWLKNAQGNDGGWGAGTHTRQDIMDPHAVPSDPATTALVAMALLRTENTLSKGSYSNNLKKANEFLLKAVEQCPDNQPYLTTLTNTQPQTKLGRNIDVILTSQFFTNL
jgi:hypothetical protein